MSRRFKFLSVGISVIGFKNAVKQISARNYPLPGYVCFADTFVVSQASKDVGLNAILAQACMVMPDGKPLQWFARLQGHKEVTTVSGLHLCTSLLNTGMSHYFYGADDKVIQKIKKNLTIKFPAAKILGFKAPPYLKMEDLKDSAVVAEDIYAINKLKPDLVWIGISSPKQDYLMHHFYTQLDKSLLLGVGGVFLYLADDSLLSPEWLKNLGFRWLYRLIKEPRRLWPKYYKALGFIIKNAGHFLSAFLSRSRVSRSISEIV
ncbi:MAG: WecB/TagA/CpsF family glycosyltransferase [Chitinophagaceae bacterium]